MTRQTHIHPRPRPGRPSWGILSRWRGYLADVGVGLMLAALLWGFAVAAGVLQP